jgi:eukaryotic-like serine/threonine-protein kinase
MKISTINRFFNVLLGALAMVAVAILSAYLAMRIAIHGREVEVPPLANLSLTDAAKKTAALGLRLNVENHFYSAAILPGLVLSQSPAPGATVRRGWTVRITQSLGPQQVSIPSLTGQTERPATITLRRLSLDLGAVAHIPYPGATGIVLAQTPTANGSGVDSPRVSLLISAPEPGSDADANSNSNSNASSASTPATAPNSDAEPAHAFVMPSLTGLTLSAAYARATAAGLHIVSAEDLNNSPNPTSSSTPATTAPATAGPFTPPATTALESAQSFSPATVVAQSPPSGHRVQPGDPVRLTLGH